MDAAGANQTHDPRHDGQALTESALVSHIPARAMTRELTRELTREFITCRGSSLAAAARSVAGPPPRKENSHVRGIHQSIAIEIFEVRQHGAVLHERFLQHDPS